MALWAVASLGWAGLSIYRVHDFDAMGVHYHRHGGGNHDPLGAGRVGLALRKKIKKGSLTSAEPS